MTPEERKLRRMLILSVLVETAKKKHAMDRRAAGIKMVIDQIPAVHAANDKKFGARGGQGPVHAEGSPR
jgi:hypothetical protein